MSTEERTGDKGKEGTRMRHIIKASMEDVSTAAAAGGEQLDIHLQLIERIYSHLSVQIAVMSLYRAGADMCQLRNILDGIAVHIVLQDGAFRTGQRPLRVIDILSKNC